MTRIKAIVFDMDGVLIDAKEWHYEALNRALALFGHAISRHDHLSTFDGLPTKRKLEMLAVQDGLPRELIGFISEMKQRYTMDLVYRHCRPTFVHEFALSRLKAEGYKLAVASNSIRNSVIVMMEMSSLAPYLDVQLSNEDVIKAKPDPEIYTEAMRRLGTTPAETLVVEDNEHGIRAATDSGAHVLVVRETTDVTHDTITRKIAAIEGQP